MSVDLHTASVRNTAQMIYDFHLKVKEMCLKYRIPVNQAKMLVYLQTQPDFTEELEKAFAVKWKVPDHIQVECDPNSPE